MTPMIVRAVLFGPMTSTVGAASNVWSPRVVRSPWSATAAIGGVWRSHDACRRRRRQIAHRRAHGGDRRGAALKSVGDLRLRRKSMDDLAAAPPARAALARPAATVSIDWVGGSVIGSAVPGWAAVPTSGVPAEVESTSMPAAAGLARGRWPRWPERPRTRPRRGHSARRGLRDVHRRPALSGLGRSARNHRTVSARTAAGAICIRSGYLVHDPSIGRWPRNVGRYRGASDFRPSSRSWRCVDRRRRAGQRVAARWRSSGRR